MQLGFGLVLVRDRVCVLDCSEGLGVRVCLRLLWRHMSVLWN